MNDVLRRLHTRPEGDGAGARLGPCLTYMQTNPIE